MSVTATRPSALSSWLLLLMAASMLVLSGCASKAKKETPPAASPTPSKATPPRTKPAPKIPAPAQPQPRSKSMEAEQIVGLLPAYLKDKESWATDILEAFDALKFQPSKENVCAVLAEIEQESAFQAEPAVPGLPRIVRKELETRKEKYGIPQWAMDKGLAMQSPNGLTYNERIDMLKTENDVNDLFQDMISEVPMGKKFLADYNPVHTGGPMQVNMDFANSYAAAKGYPFPYAGSLRNALFSRKGGLYFGIAYLMDYPANYDSLTYRFADYNAGRYSSRNAAFQKAVSIASGTPLNLDGDLLGYKKDGTPQEEPSQTLSAAYSLAPRLGMEKDMIFRTLMLEKTPTFERTLLYVKVFELAPGVPRALVPEITLKSPKFSRKLTTTMYAKQVENRYRRCMKK